jgi:hypothetical protein
MEGEREESPTTESDAKGCDAFRARQKMGHCIWPILRKEW